MAGYQTPVAAKPNKYAFSSAAVRVASYSSASAYRMTTKVALLESERKGCIFTYQVCFMNQKIDRMAVF